jgi:ribose 5-phosphate isomerase RpiB
MIDEFLEHQWDADVGAFGREQTSKGEHYPKAVLPKIGEQGLEGLPVVTISGNGTGLGLASAVVIHKGMLACAPADIGGARSRSPSEKKRAQVRCARKSLPKEEGRKPKA